MSPMSRIVLTSFLCMLCGAAAAASLPAQQYVGMAQRAMEEELRSRGGRIEVAARGEYRDIELPGTSALEVKTRVAQGHAAGSALVWIELVSEGRIERRVPVSFRVKWFKPVLVTRTALKARSALAPQMFCVDEAEITNVRGEALSRFEQLIGKRLKHDLRENVPLGLGDVEDRPPVQAGDAIQVVATVGKVRVQRMAVAQSDGFPGQRIRARVEKENETLRVEVIGAGLARVVGDG